MEGYEGSCGANYIGSFVYNNDDDGLIRDIRFGDGIVREAADGVYETLYWVTDHLGSPAVTVRVTLSHDTTSYVFDTVGAEEYSDAGEVWDDLNSQFESAGITWAEIYELGKEESESYTVRLRMEVNKGYSDRYLNFGHNGAELVICQQGMPLPDPDDDPELRCRKNFCKFVILSLNLMGQNHDL